MGVEPYKFNPTNLGAQLRVLPFDVPTGYCGLSQTPVNFDTLAMNKPIDFNFQCNNIWQNMTFTPQQCNLNYDFNFNIFTASRNNLKLFDNFDFNQSLFNFNTNLFRFNNYNFGHLGNYNFTTPAENKSPVAPKAKSKALHWSKVTDAEMRQIYGNYDYDIRTTYTGGVEQLNRFLEKYPNSELHGKGDIFIKAQNKYHISALVLLAICGAETTYGTKGKAVAKHNFANIEKPKGANYSGRWRKFNNAEECIMELARLLSENYVTSPGKGKVQSLTKLYQVNAKYCPAAETHENAGWAKLVNSCMKKILAA